MVKVIEFFAGIGAQRQALKDLGIEHEVIAISEIDKYAIKAYETSHGPTLNLGDIREIKDVPKVDLWTYSFPCTDISIAGHLKGFEKGSNTNSSLLWEIERLLFSCSKNDKLPKYLLLENVKNIISKKFKQLFDEWCKWLERLGYKNFYKILDAQNYGVPQHRERVFMVSILDENSTFRFPEPIELKRKLKDMLETDVDEKYYVSTRMIETFSDMTNRNGLIRGLQFKPKYKDEDVARTITSKAGSRPCDNFIIEPVIAQKENVVIVPQATKDGYAIANVGDGIYTNRCSFKRGVVQKDKIPTLKTSNTDLAVVTTKDELISIRRLTPRECFRLMGFNDVDISKLIDSKAISDCQLYKIAGNSIVVDCLKAIFKNLFEEIK